MSAGSPQRPLDLLRKALIVLVLVGGVVLLHRFSVPQEDFDPRGLLALGFLMLAAHAVGDLVGIVRLPHITGYLLAGVLFGPSIGHVVHGIVPEWLLEIPPFDEGIVSSRVLGQVGPIDALALALIALTAGGELKAAELRRSLPYVVAMVGGMFACVVTGVTLLLLGVNAAFPDAIPALVGLPSWPATTVALAMAVLAAATSPAVAIAVVNSTGARGPVATTVLTTVVAGEVSAVLLFSAVSSLVLSVLGLAGDVTVLDTLIGVGFSIVFGAGVGALLAAYLRYVAVDVPLFLVAVVYASTFVLQEFHGEAALVFICAGFVVGNLSTQGEALIHEVERLTKPVYVVFFALAGAKLHLDLLISMLVPALCVFAVRFAGVRIGAVAGARFARAPEAVQRYAWMGLVSQAGMAIALANQSRTLLPSPIGDGVFSMAIALISINELVGPTVLQSALRSAGEVAGHTPERAGPDATAPAAHEAGGWRERVDTGHERLDRVLGDLREDLRAILRATVEGALRELSRDREERLRLLRRELLRVTRTSDLHSGSPREHAAALRAEVAEVATAWRDLVRELADETGRTWSPLALVHAVDEALAHLPESVFAPVTQAVLSPRPEPVWTRLRRLVLRARTRVVPAWREVGLRDLARYHLSGEVPGRLVPVAARLVAADLELADDVGRIAGQMAVGLEACAELADSGAEPAVVHARVQALQKQADQAFRAAIGRVTASVAEALDLAARVVAGAHGRLCDDAVVVGTLDLPHRHRRYGRVFERRNQGVAALSAGLGEARRGVVGRYTLLALDLELLGLQGRALEPVRAHGGALARKVVGRGVHQLRRADAEVGGWLDRATAALDGGTTPSGLAELLREAGPAVAHHLRDAQGTAAQLSAELAEERWVAELGEAVLEGAHHLSEAYAVPTGVPAASKEVLAPAPGSLEVAFRDLVAAFVEARVVRELHERSVALASDVREMEQALGELCRVFAFHLELATAELDLLEETTEPGLEPREGSPTPPTETLEVARAMVAAVTRTRHRLERLAQEVESRAALVEDDVQAAVVGLLDDLRRTFASGRVAETRTTWLPDGTFGGQLARRARRWRGLVPETSRRATEVVRGAIGPERIGALRASLGLPAEPALGDLRASFAPPEPGVQVPAIYRRLFADLSSEAGDLLAGRRVELDRLRAALAPGGRHRSAALVGLDPYAAATLARAAARETLDGELQLDATRPVDVAGVERWLERVAAVRNHAVVVTGLGFLFERRPGGYAPLERLVEGLLASRSENAFVLLADSAVWQHVARAVAVEDAVGATVELGALAADELERVLMSRHAMSGYDVAFDADEDLAWQLRHAFLRGEDRERRRKAWFRTLHAASGGVLQDALRLWVASVVEVDDGAERLRLGPVPQVPVGALAALPEEVLLTLLEATRQGWTGAAQHQRLFRTPRLASSAHLVALRHAGLLVPAFANGEEHFRVAPHLRAPLQRVLAARGWA